MDDRANPTSDTGLFDANFVGSPDDLNRLVRAAAFGEDIGQFSWTTATELRHLYAILGITAGSHVLEVASGMGGPALFMAESTGCRVTGVDIHAAGVEAATDAAVERGLAERVRFLVHDARTPLPFGDGAFDAVVSIDSMNHIYDRAALFAELSRVLRSGGRLGFTDAVVVTGRLRRDEVIARSSAMGEFVFTPAGEHERMLAAAGFVDVRAEDVSEGIARVSADWYAARARFAADLDVAEGPQANADFQRFLDVVHTLSAERRLSRFAYLASRA